MPISTSDIAELVDERLSVVSTWRKRFKNGPNAFPQPVGGTPARPLFDFEEVREWVAANRPEKDIHAGVLRVRVWSAIRSMSGGIDQFDLVYWLHLELRHRKAILGPTVSRRASLSAEADAYATGIFGAEWPAEVNIIRSLIASMSDGDLVDVSDFALARLGAGYGRSGGDVGAVGSNIAEILAAAALAFSTDAPEPPDVAVIYDPACGIGETLIKIVSDYQRFGKRAKAIGVESNAAVATIASTRLELRDIPATIETADSLSRQLFSDQRPHVIVAEPPLGLKWSGVWSPDDSRSEFSVPPTRSADLAWVVDAASRLEGKAGALVLTGMGALSNGGAEERVRTDLVRAGAVEAVIALPPNLLQYTSVPLALWVLRAPSENAGNLVVSLLDASSPDIDGTASKRADWLRSNIPYWVIDPFDANPSDGVRTSIVHLDELLDAGGMDLTPNRWASRPGYSDLLNKLQDDGGFLAYELEGFRRLDAPLFDTVDAAPHVVTIREMTEFPESREAKLWSGRSLPNEDAPADTITSKDIGKGVLRPGRVDSMSELGFWTEPGDIVFTTMTRVKAVVDREGGHRIGNGVYALRLDPSSRFDPEYVAICLAARWNDRHQKGSTIKHAKPGDLEIPLLPLEMQAEWTWSFRELRKLVARAQDIARQAEELEITAQNALRFGHPDAK